MSRPTTQMRKNVSRQQSLFLNETAFHDAAVEATSHVGDDLKDNPNALNDTDAMIRIARRFLTNSAPSLLDVLDDHYDAKSSSDRLVKIGRNVSSTMRHARRTASNASLTDLAEQPQQEESVAAAAIPAFSKEKIDTSLRLLADESSELADLLLGEGKVVPKKVPKVRFGKTELQMPVVTLGCMRFQQSWNGGPNPVLDMSQVEDECQENLVKIIRHAHHCGINHIETAKAYGSSQLQIGFALKTLLDAGEIKREELIIQTKGGVSSSMTIKDYKEQILNSIDLLQLDYIDLFAVHGLNTQSEYDLLFDNPKGENLIVAVQELKQEGKLRHIGFSTHGPADLTQRAIETDCFEYVNLHYHFCGSYTASGDGEFGGNLNNVRLAHEKDMGLFVISAADKGGRLYAPSNKLRDLCLPDFEPMTYGCVWLWQHAMHDKKKAPIHTLVIGAARPSDLDQPVLASHLLLSDQEELADRRQRVSDRLDKAMEEALGKDWVNNWHIGVPNAHTSTYQTHHSGIVWTHNLIKAWGMLDFAKDRYGPMEGHLKNWSLDKSKEENLKAMGPGFGWMPGTALDASLDYTIDFENCPDKNKEPLLKAIQFVHELVSKDGAEKKDGKEQKTQEKSTIPLDWEVAYDMRPWCAFPER